jgi:type IV pilus assembly protein PilW
MLVMRPQRLHHRQRGLSLVELMVGIAVGLFVLAGATLMLSTQLGDNRRLLLETQLQQDLRATMDIITRELRRAGTNFEASMNNVWQPGYPTPTPNALAALTISEDGSEIVYRYRRGGAQGPYGFRFADERIRSLIGVNWQELTDANVMKVTSFSVTEEPVATEVMPCPRICSDGTTACWPTLSVRTLSISIEAEAVSDASVKRSQSSRIRLRNDVLGFNNGAGPLCPT